MGTVFLIRKYMHTHRVKKGRGRLVKLVLSHRTLLQEVGQALHLMELFVKLLFVSELYCVSCLALLIYLSSVDSRWQQYSAHLHTNSAQNNTMRHNTQNRTYITIRIHTHNNKITVIQYSCHVNFVI